MTLNKIVVVSLPAPEVTARCIHTHQELECKYNACDCVHEYTRQYMRIYGERK